MIDESKLAKLKAPESRHEPGGPTKGHARATITAVVEISGEPTSTAGA